VAENTSVRLYNPDIMSEFMGRIYGVYDAKPEGLSPGHLAHT